MKITAEMLERYGYSDGCHRCRALQRGHMEATVAHTKDCRKRIEAEAVKDPVYQERLQKAVDRKTRFLADEVERADLAAKKIGDESASKSADVAMPQGGTPDAAAAAPPVDEHIVVSRPGSSTDGGPIQRGGFGATEPARENICFGG